jgi:16S rRNA (guanine527-N7)-methyltransferase
MGFTRNIETDRAVLGALVGRLGLPLGVLSLLIAHAEAVRAATARLGLVSSRDVEHIAERHTADSLLFALARMPRHGERWLDVGSGAGFPGVVLASCFPDTTFTLLEPLKKRAGFLQLTAVDLGLSNVSVDDRRLEDLDDLFDVAVARALSSPIRALRSMVGAVRAGGDAVVAVGSEAALEDPARLVQVEPAAFVDSPGRFFMMTSAG